MYIKRSLENRVKYMAEHFPVILISGARQVGKTTMLKRITEDITDIQYVTLDHPRIRQVAKEDPELFLQQYSTPVIIDEIQYAQDWDRWLKTIYDMNPETKVVATGSASPALMKGSTERLTVNGYWSTWSRSFWSKSKSSFK